MATAIVVGVSTGVLKPLLSKLTKLLEQEYVKLKGVRKQIKFLRDELSTMSAALEMLADEEQLDPLKKKWRDRVRELAYDIEDCVDSFMVRVGHDGPKGFKGFFRKMKQLKVRHRIGNEIEELKRLVIEVSESHKRYIFDKPSPSSSTSFVDPRLAALYENVDKLVGIDGAKKHIIEWLTMGTNGSFTGPKVVSIVGCGGLGKTTLAYQVYQTIRSQFSCAAFVSISQNPDMKRILRDIAKAVGITDVSPDDNEQQLIDKFRENLKDKRYFIVIDDLWNAKHWEPISLALLNNNCGSRIITTTRSATVASYCSPSSQGHYVYQKESLSFDDSKRLFFARAFGSEDSCYPHLEDVPDKILRKCDGLPLAIMTVSSMLANKLAKEEWDRVLNAIGSALAKTHDAEKMTSILSLSYNDIPHHLRTCLLYLSVFPEDYKIKKERLINRWIAEGFIHMAQEQSAYEVGECYFNELINRSMIQPVDIEYNQAEACRVHDIILDYLKCKAVEENFMTSLDDAGHGYTQEYKVRRLVVTNNDWNKETFTIPAEIIMSHVRSLSIFGDAMPTLLSFTALRVLDCWIREDNQQLAGIENLFHVRYLRIEGSIWKLPEKIGELQHLQTLDVQDTGIIELPPSITKLHRLTRLYVCCDVIFQNGVIGHMQSLEELREYGVRSCEQGKSLQEFSKLTKLRTLAITLKLDLPAGSEGRRQAEGIHSYMGTVLASCILHNLYIRDDTDKYIMLLDSWHPTAHCSLRKLGMNDCAVYKAPNWMASLGNLEVLELLMICLRPEDVDILGEIPTLVFLELCTAGGTNGRIVVHGSNRFRSLKYFCLNIALCGTALKFEAGSMPKLEHVKLGFPMHKIECLNGASDFGIQHLSALSKVEVKIRSNRSYENNYDPADDKNDDTVKCCAGHIKSAAETLPNRPTIRFETEYDEICDHYETALRKYNKKKDGILTEWFKIWGIEEEQTEQETGGEAEQKDETNQEGKEEQTDEEEDEEQHDDIDNTV